MKALLFSLSVVQILTIGARQLSRRVKRNKATIMIKLTQLIHLPKVVDLEGEMTVKFRHTASKKEVEIKGLPTTSRLYYSLVAPLELFEVGEYEYTAKIDDTIVDAGLAYVEGTASNKKIYKNDKTIKVYE